MDVEERRRCARAAASLRASVGEGKYAEIRALARAYQRNEVDAEHLANALRATSSSSTSARASVRACAEACPSEFHREKLLAALGKWLDADARGSRARERERRAETLAPGLVCLRKFISPELQTWLVDTSFLIGESSDATHGFFERASDGSARLNQGSRGRMILDVDAFPETLRDMCADAVSAAQAVDAEMPGFNPTTVLVNFYKEGAEFKWHKDSEDPKLVKAKTGPPIVSFTVGLSADFGYKRSFEDPTHEVIRLNSGDVLLFGGPSRMIVHSVLNVHPGSMPGHLRGKMLNGRLNVTVRDIGDGVIDKSQFPQYRVSYDGVPAEGNV